jgi:molecular chaperone GrpE (heat shock protein)
MEKIEAGIEQLITIDKKIICDLKHENERLEQQKNELFRKLVKEIILLIDTHDNAVSTIKERQWNSGENSIHIMERYATIKNRAINLLEKNGVKKILFPDNKLILEYCKTVDTEPNSAMDNDTIISVEKDGYIKGDEVIRVAEVVIVKN